MANPVCDVLLTDERLKTFADGKDPQLAALMFQFGRYLLISSSRRGGKECFEVVV